MITKDAAEQNLMKARESFKVKSESAYFCIEKSVFTRGQRCTVMRAILEMYVRY